MKFCKVSLFLALLVAVCLPAVAQTSLRLDIPFNFIAAGKTLPAGHYTVARVSDMDSDAWRISGDRASVVVLTNPGESLRTAHARSLVFLKAGDGYSLVKIWDAEHFGRELRRSNVKQTLVAEGNNYVEIAAK
ncbi:MAG: hypothetical protein WCA20_10615 [Candidatus Sulfotelmatobacter sp.]